MTGQGPAPVTITNAAGRARFVLVCEHASNWIPPEYGGLGLPDADLQRHIAWDIGALSVAHRLSRLLDAPLVEAGVSRLLVDLNRPVGSETSMPEVSESTAIPGNLGLGPAERDRRIKTWFDPFQSALADLLDRRLASGQPTALIAVHSFTPVFLGKRRSMQAGILYRRSRTFGEALVDALGGEAAGIARNEPYQIDDASDYTVPVHGEARGLDSVLVELRQDLVGSDAGAADWAGQLAAALWTTVREGAHRSPA